MTMGFSFVLRRAAANDIDDIAAYIQEDNPSRAQSFTEEISQKISVITERPLSFPARDDVAPNLRSALLGHYLIFFRVHSNNVEILRVIHGARDLESIF
jgi:toxin ParE1/3/4